MAERRDDFVHERGHVHLDATARCGTRLLANDLDLGGNFEWIVRADLAAEAILQGGDDATPVRVVVGVGRRDENHVEWQANLVTTDLHVALFEDVQQTDLDALGEVGQFVDGEDAAVRARNEAVMQRQFVRQVTPLGDLDRVDFTNEVGDRRVGGRQLLTVPLGTVHPRNRRVVTHLCDKIARVTRHRVVGVVVDLAARNDWHPLIQEARERTNHAGLCLAALAEEHDVVARQQRILQLRHDRVLVTHDTCEQRFTGANLRNRIATHLVFHRHGLPARRTQRAEGRGKGRGGGRHAGHGGDSTPSGVLTSQGSGPSGPCRYWVSGFLREITV